MDEILSSNSSKVESKPAQNESKALLRFQLREAREEIERLKSNVKNEKSIELGQMSASVQDLDGAILDYLERKGYQYSAATMIDEVQIESKGGTKLEDMLVGQTTDDSEVNSLRESVQMLESQLKSTKEQLSTAKTELKEAKSEIDRFSASLVTNILDGVTSEVTYQPVVEADRAEENRHFVSEKLFNMINTENGSTLNNNELIASNLEELLQTIEKTIEPLLSGILLKELVSTFDLATY